MGGKHIRQGLTIRLGAIDRARLEVAARDSEMTVAQWIASVASEEAGDHALDGEIMIEDWPVKWKLHGDILTTYSDPGADWSLDVLCRKLGIRRLIMRGRQESGNCIVIKWEVEW